MSRKALGCVAKALRPYWEGESPSRRGSAGRNAARGLGVAREGQRRKEDMSKGKRIDEALSMSRRREQTQAQSRYGLQHGSEQGQSMDAILCNAK